jgi:hypothetical protein
MDRATGAAAHGNVSGQESIEDGSMMECNEHTESLQQSPKRSTQLPAAFVPGPVIEPVEIWRACEGNRGGLHDMRSSQENKGTETLQDEGNHSPKKKRK